MTAIRPSVGVARRKVSSIETSPSNRESIHSTAMLMAILIDDDAEYEREWNYLASAFGKSDLFKETMGWEWLQRHKYLFGRRGQS